MQKERSIPFGECTTLIRGKRIALIIGGGIGRRGKKRGVNHSAGEEDEAHYIEEGRASYLHFQGRGEGADDLKKNGHGILDSSAGRKERSGLGGRRKKRFRFLEKKIF